MGTTKTSVIVELYDLAITERPDDRFGRVVTSKSLSENDLVEIAVSRRTDLNASTLKSSIEILKEIAMEEVANGASVNFGLGYFNLGVNGVFIGDNPGWDSSQHKLIVKATPNAQLRSKLNDTKVNIRGLAVSGPIINRVYDVSSAQENTTLTPGGGVNIEGSKIKIEGTEEGVGLFLLNQADSNEIAIPQTSILVNDPSKITFIVPANITAGDYKLRIGTQFSKSGIPLKEIKVIVFDSILNIDTNR